MVVCCRVLCNKCDGEQRLLNGLTINRHEHLSEQSIAVLAFSRTFCRYFFVCYYYHSALHSSVE